MIKTKTAASAFDAAYNSYTLIKLGYEAPAPLNAMDRTDYTELKGSLFDDWTLSSGLETDEIMFSC